MSSASDLVDVLAHEEIGDGPLVVLMPGAGDIRAEYRFVAAPLAAAGYRVVSADLPGHGASAPAKRYGVGHTADALAALLDRIGQEPAVVVGCSFAPCAALWLAAERPELVRGVVAISPHLDEERSLQAIALRTATRGLLRGPWAGRIFARLYASWYKARPPEDLPAHLDALRAMFRDPARRRAARDTLTADRDGLAARIAGLSLPTLTIFGSADDHFADPAGEARSVARRLGGDVALVEGAGHYPHVEFPDQVVTTITQFLRGLA